MAAKDVVAWRLLTFLHQTGELWVFEPGLSEGARSWIHKAFEYLFELLPSAAKERRIVRALKGERLVCLARLFFCGIEEIAQQTTAVEGQVALNRDVRMGEGTETWVVDEVKLAHILSVAGQMTLDARRLPSVMAEHLGMDEQLTVGAIQTQLAEAEWQRTDPNGLSLHLECTNHAIDFALDRAIATLRDHLERLRQEEPDLREFYLQVQL